MKLKHACSYILSQLTDLVTQLDQHHFTMPVDSLSQSSVGQHLRHTLEFFFCFQHGYEQGVINYDKRSHDKLMETDKFLALSAMSKISEFISQLDDRALKLEVGYALDREDFVTLETTASRELVYNIEHAVHHMAIMKIGIREVAPYINLPNDFGIAASTIRHKETVSAAH